MTWSVSVQWIVLHREKGRRIDLGESRRECARKARRNDRGECRRGDGGAFSGFAGAPVVALSSSGTRTGPGPASTMRPRCGAPPAGPSSARLDPARLGFAGCGSAGPVDVERRTAGGRTAESVRWRAGTAGRDQRAQTERPGGRALVASRTEAPPGGLPITSSRTAGREESNGTSAGVGSTSRRRRWHPQHGSVRRGAGQDRRSGRSGIRNRGRGRPFHGLLGSASGW